MHRQIYNLKIDKYLFKHISEIWINSFTGPLKMKKEASLQPVWGDLFRRKTGRKL